MGRAFAFRKERKLKRWSAMAKTFTKISKDIVMAVKESGMNPQTNSRLRAVIQNAKAVNMPKENIARAIKKASDTDTANYKEVVFEGYAPHGIAVLCEAATDNNNRTVAHIRAAFNKHGGTLGTAGTVLFMFDHICTFNIEKESLKTDLEALELALIDFEVAEIFSEQNEIIIHAPFEQFGFIQYYLEKNNFKISSSGFERIPKTTKKLDSTAQQEVTKLLERLEADADVQNVYHSMEF